MPYTHKKVGSKFVVYKSGKKVGETQGTKTALNKYLAALHIADKKSQKKESKVVKEGIEEIRLSKIPHNVVFWVVENPKSPTENPDMLVFQSDPFTFARQVLGGLREDEVYGFFMDEEEASNAAHDLIDSVYESAKNLELKKETVLEKLNKHINKLQRDINGHMKAASELPEEADKHHMMAERKMQMIKSMRDKHKMVEAAKKTLPQKEEE